MAGGEEWDLCNESEDPQEDRSAGFSRAGNADLNAVPIRPKEGNYSEGGSSGSGMGQKENDYGYGVVDVMAAIEYDTSNVNDDMLPEEFSIIKVYPNPFNPSTTIWFRVETMHATSLQIYDITGQLVETLVDNIVNPGEYKIEWHANNMTSGIYFVQLIADDQQLAKKITLIK